LLVRQNEMADRETLKLREGGNRNCCLEISRLFSRARKQKKTYLNLFWEFWKIRTAFLFVYIVDSVLFIRKFKYSVLLYLTWKPPTR